VLIGTANQIPTLPPVLDRIAVSKYRLQRRQAVSAAGSLFMIWTKPVQYCEPMQRGEADERRFRLTGRNPAAYCAEPPSSNDDPYLGI
jgi:hypothetical protein